MFSQTQIPVHLGSSSAMVVTQNDKEPGYWGSDGFGDHKFAFEPGKTLDIQCRV